MKELIYIMLYSMFFFSCKAQSGSKISIVVFEKGITEKGSQLLDVRTIEEYNNGHIENAVQANWNNQDEFKNKIASLDKSKPVYLYCQVGGRSGAAAAWFVQNGFKKVYDLKGGFSAWKAADKPIE
jgi:rhodanese-related sulfurtransferase